MTRIEFFSKIPKGTDHFDFEIVQIELTRATKIAPGTDAELLGLGEDVPGSTIILDNSLLCAPFIDASALMRLKMDLSKNWDQAAQSVPSTPSKDRQFIDFKGMQLERHSAYRAEAEAAHPRTPQARRAQFRLI